MIDLGCFSSAGQAWQCVLDFINRNGTERDYTDNVNEWFRVKECFDLCVSVENGILPDPLIEKYKDEKEYEFMVRNFTSFDQVEELHNASSYAERLYAYCGQKNQIGWVVKRLKENPEQRSCAITNFEPLTDELYIPCVSMLDFQKSLEKDHVLDLYVYCRALDWGSKAYMNMVMLMSVLMNVCRETDMKPGRMEVIVKSAHYRLSDENKVMKIIKNQ